MHLPDDNTKVYDHPLAKLWFHKVGILHKLFKETHRTAEKVKDLYSYIRTLTKGRKVCAILEVSKEGISDKHSIEYLKQEIPHTFSAAAFMASTQMGQLTGT